MPVDNDNIQRIRELYFTYKGKDYRFSFDQVEYKNELGRFCHMFDLPISYSKYNNKEVIGFICKLGIEIYSQGIEEGKLQKQCQIKQVLGII